MKEFVPYRKNLTRFTYESTAFQGWRLCISREGKTFVKYFSDKKFGSGEAALEAAEIMLEKVNVIFDSAKKEQDGITWKTLGEVEKVIR